MTIKSNDFIPTSPPEDFYQVGLYNIHTYILLQEVSTTEDEEMLAKTEEASYKVIRILRDNIYLVLLV